MADPADTTVPDHPSVAGRDHASEQVGAASHPAPGTETGDPASTTTPVVPVTGAAPPLPGGPLGGSPVVTPEEVSLAEAQVADLQLQEETVRQLLTLLADAATSVRQGYPEGVDLGAFGGSRRGSRMARHTAGAQERVMRALDMASEALAQHQTAITVFRDDLEQVESEAADLLAILKQRSEDVVVSVERSVD
ncbi:hypothetical protein [Nocardioides nanhaiensis]|uniref:Uncharacterized protein n=1 Tax=Nocardioides nanhaiensis TaxID=1476871 RepID=A0ABP8WG19_9ACTN